MKLNAIKSATGVVSKTHYRDTVLLKQSNFMRWSAEHPSAPTGKDIKTKKVYLLNAGLSTVHQVEKLLGPTFFINKLGPSSTVSTNIKSCI